MKSRPPYSIHFFCEIEKWPGPHITSGYADGHRVQMYFSITNYTEIVMAILMISRSRGKMPLDEMLHTLREMLS